MVLSDDELCLLLENTMQDLKKKDISPIVRGKLVHEFLERNSFTLSEGSRYLDIPKTTLFGWLQYNKLPLGKFEELQQSGLSKTQIFEIVKNPKVMRNVEKLNPYVYELKNMRMRAREIRLMIKPKELNVEVETLIKDVVNELNRLLIKKN